MTEQEHYIERLRQRELQGKLTADERGDLDAYYRSFEAKEAAILHPVLERLERQAERQETTLSRLDFMRQEKSERLNHIRSLIREIETIEAEEHRLLVVAKAS